MDELLKYLGGLSPEERESFALRCGTSVGYLRKACSIGQRLGESLCINIERESQGAVRCEAMRPDVDWAYLRNSRPELAQSQAEPAQAAIKTVVNGACAVIEQLERQAEKTLQQAADKLLAQSRPLPEPDALPPINRTIEALAASPLTTDAALEAELEKAERAGLVHLPKKALVWDGVERHAGGHG